MQILSSFVCAIIIVCGNTSGVGSIDGNSLGANDGPDGSAVGWSIEVRIKVTKNPNAKM